MRLALRVRLETDSGEYLASRRCTMDLNKEESAKVIMLAATQWFQDAVSDVAKKAAVLLKYR